MVKIIGICIGVAVALFVGVYFFRSTTQLWENEPQTAEYSCSREVKICANGSSVRRSGPACDFAACPGTSTTTPVSNTVSAAASIGQTIAIGTLSVSPIELIEESRCPSDVVCIQAGTVRVKTKLSEGNIQETIILKLNESVMFNGKNIELTAVSPAPRSQEPPAPSSYRFTFEVR